MLETTSAIIMASGSSKRMGRNKVFLKYKNQTFLERTLQLVTDAGFLEVILVIRPEDAEKISVPESVKVVINTQSDTGQSASVRLGAGEAVGQGCLFLTIDQPLLTLEILEKIAGTGKPDRIVIPTCDGTPSSPVFFGADFFQELLEAEGDNGGRSVRDAHPEAWLTVPVPVYYLQDVDMPEDYAKLLEGISE